MTKIEINGTEYQVVFESLHHNVSCDDCDYKPYCVELDDKPCEEFDGLKGRNYVAILKTLYKKI